MNNNPDFLPDLFANISIAVSVLLGLKMLATGRFKKASLLLAGTLIFSVYVLVFTPYNAVVATDRANYMNMFLYGSFGHVDDIGFMWYINAIKVVIGNNFYLFLLVSSIIYIGGYLYFTKTLVSRKWELIILMWFLNIGFLAYFCNTMREGMALSMVVCGYAFAFKGRQWMAAALFAVAVMFHFSVALAVLGWLATTKDIKVKYYYFFWIVLLILSYLDLAAPLTNLVSLTGHEKSIDYAQALSEAGFRYDFILYSLYPLLTGAYFVSGLGYNNPQYLRLFKVYIFINAVWLIFVRIPYTDRIVFQSWYLIPFIVMMPLIDETQNNPIKRRYHLAGIFIIFACIIKLLIGR